MGVGGLGGRWPNVVCAYLNRSGVEPEQAADRFWTASVCQRGMLLHVKNEWYLVLGNTPCITYVPFLKQ